MMMHICMGNWKSVQHMSNFHAVDLTSQVANVVNGNRMEWFLTKYSYSSNRNYLQK